VLIDLGLSGLVQLMPQVQSRGRWKSRCTVVCGGRLIADFRKVALAGGNQCIQFLLVIGGKLRQRSAVAGWRLCFVSTCAYHHERPSWREILLMATRTGLTHRMGAPLVIDPSDLVSVGTAQASLCVKVQGRWSAVLRFHRSLPPGPSLSRPRPKSLPPKTHPSS